MKLVKCIVRTHKADETMDALMEIDLSGAHGKEGRRTGAHHACRRSLQHSNPGRRAGLATGPLDRT